MSFFDWWQSQIRVIPDSRIYFQESVELILSFFCFCFFKPIVFFLFKQTRSMQTPIVFSIDNVFFVCLFCSSIFAFVWNFFLSNWVQNTAIVIGFRHSYTHRWGGNISNWGTVIICLQLKNASMQMTWWYTYDISISRWHRNQIFVQCNCLMQPLPRLMQTIRAVPNTQTIFTTLLWHYFNWLHWNWENLYGPSHS